MYERIPPSAHAASSLIVLGLYFVGCMILGHEEAKEWPGFYACSSGIALGIGSLILWRKRHVIRDVIRDETSAEEQQ